MTFRRVAGWVVPALGVGLVGALLVGWWVFDGTLDPRAGDHLSEFLTTGAFSLALTVGGVVLRGGVESIPPARHPRVVAWTLGVLAAFALLGVLVDPVDLGASETALDQTVDSVLLAASVGGLSGFLIGGMEARALERVHALACRNEAERARLDYLNRVLRHEVLNGMAIVRGYAEESLNRPDVPAETRADLEVIRDRADEVATVARDVRVLLRAATDRVDVEKVDLAAVVKAEADALRTFAPEVDLTVETEDDLWVLGDELLPRALGNLLQNAVEHNDGDAPRVAVTATGDDDRVTVVVSDDGPGLPPERRADPFGRGEYGDDGLGLYIVGTLVERYDGTVELTETGPEGSTFTLTFPVADAATVDPRPPVERPVG